MKECRFFVGYLLLDDEIQQSLEGLADGLAFQPQRHQVVAVHRQILDLEALVFRQEGAQNGFHIFIIGRFVRRAGAGGNEVGALEGQEHLRPHLAVLAQAAAQSKISVKKQKQRSLQLLGS